MWGSSSLIISSIAFFLLKQSLFTPAREIHWYSYLKCQDTNFINPSHFYAAFPNIGLRAMHNNELWVFINRWRIHPITDNYSIIIQSVLTEKAHSSFQSLEWGEWAKVFCLISGNVPAINNHFSRFTKTVQCTRVQRCHLHKFVAVSFIQLQS